MFVVVEQVELTGVGGLGLRGDRNLFVLLSVYGSLWFGLRHGESVKSVLARGGKVETDAQWKPNCFMRVDIGKSP